MATTPKPSKPIANKTSKPVAPAASSPSGGALQFDPAKGVAAFKKLTPRLRALPVNTLKRINLDVGSASLVALAVANFVSKKPLLSRFESLPAGEFDIAYVKDLPDVAWAASYAAREASRLHALLSDVRVPLELIKEATEIEGRMQRCCEYLLSDDKEMAPRLDLLRPGTGHRDLVNDLFGYAEIYDLRHDVVDKDPKNYRPGDRNAAIEKAEAILGHIVSSLTPAQKQALDDLMRARTLLETVYGEVAETGRWLERHDPTSEARYPSLYSGGRENKGGRPRGSKKAPAPDGEGDK